jgi:uncharacterized protein YggU (UPF0235/DUF167 family)
MAEPPHATTRLRLRVSPGARRTELVGRYADGWKVRVSAAPERGRANEAVVDLLARRLGLDRNDISLVSGHAARDKVVELRGLRRAEAERKLSRRQDESGPRGPNT